MLQAGDQWLKVKNQMSETGDQRSNVDNQCQEAREGRSKGQTPNVTE